MLTTRFTELVGCSAPIQQAGMAGGKSSSTPPARSEFRTSNRERIVSSGTVAGSASSQPEAAQITPLPKHSGSLRPFSSIL